MLIAGMGGTLATLFLLVLVIQLLVALLPVRPEIKEKNP
jgi:Na+-transporting methylmalonyl-CoA/oxaloacetate decarboxylase gamma subunit